jgi:hypothetical protein
MLTKEGTDARISESAGRIGFELGMVPEESRVGFVRIEGERVQRFGIVFIRH